MNDLLKGGTYPQLNEEEKLTYFRALGERILENRYRYYVLDHPVLSDYEYDYLERLYEAVAKDLGQKPIASDMVGFDPSRTDAQEAVARVEMREDFYSQWYDSMLPTWHKLGYPKYVSQQVVS